MTSTARTTVPRAQLVAVAWNFLESDYTGPIYKGWPIERRVEAFLDRKGPRALLDDGSAYEALIEQVMANIGRALRKGVLVPAFRSDVVAGRVVSGRA